MSDFDIAFLSICAAVVLAGTHFLAYIQGRVSAYQHVLEIEEKQRGDEQKEPTP